MFAYLIPFPFSGQPCRFYYPCASSSSLRKRVRESRLVPEEARNHPIVIPTKVGIQSPPIVIPAEAGIQSPPIVIPTKVGIQSPPSVIPAEAGIQRYLDKYISFYWIPACAGMTWKGRGDDARVRLNSCFRRNDVGGTQE